MSPEEEVPQAGTTAGSPEGGLACEVQAPPPLTREGGVYLEYICICEV